MFVPWELPWLPEASPDFRAHCKALAATSPDAAPHLGQRLVALASHRLNTAQAGAFASLLQALRSQKSDLAPLSPLRLGILPSATFDLVAAAIPAACARHGVAVELTIADFDQIVQVALSASSSIFQADPDAIFVQFDHRWLGFDRFVIDMADTDILTAALERVALVLDGIQANSRAQAIVTNIAVPPGALFGSLDRQVDGTVRRLIHRFNESLSDLARDRGAILLDVVALVEMVGSAHWFDPVKWNLFKLPFASDCAALFADMLARQLGAMRGKARKCLVLDCDNTLWGGVIGDDGIENIKIGSGTAEGESFAAVQKLARDFKARGILLAVCSKNFEETARGPFRDHPDMVLRENDIAVFQANWTDKPSNLEAIAEKLSIGIDSLVFLDDNSAERAQMREALPLVAVPELPADPALYPLYLSAAGYFEAISYSAEDGARAQSYAANASRAEVRETIRDLGDYLSALEMKFRVCGFDAAGRSRIVQLINKSNQFNLTARRYTEAEVREMESDAGLITLQVRLTDKFSDFGMISVVIARPVANDTTSIEIDSWLMSCRVLGRRVEEGMLEALVARARAAGKSVVRARYLPTAKNGMVSDFFDKLGFEMVGQEQDGAKFYVLDLNAFVAPILPFKTIGST